MVWLRRTFLVFSPPKFKGLLFKIKKQRPAVSVLPKDVSQEVFGIIDLNGREAAEGVQMELLPKGVC